MGTRAKAPAPFFMRRSPSKRGKIRYPNGGGKTRPDVRRAAGTGRRGRGPRRSSSRSRRSRLQPWSRARARRPGLSFFAHGGRVRRRRSARRGHRRGVRSQPTDVRRMVRSKRARLVAHERGPGPGPRGRHDHGDAVLGAALALGSLPSRSAAAGNQRRERPRDLLCRRFERRGRRAPFSGPPRSGDRSRLVVPCFRRASSDSWARALGMDGLGHIDGFATWCRLRRDGQSLRTAPGARRDQRPQS